VRSLPPESAPSEAAVPQGVAQRIMLPSAQLLHCEQERRQPRQRSNRPRHDLLPVRAVLAFGLCRHEYLAAWAHCPCAASEAAAPRWTAIASRLRNRGRFRSTVSRNPPAWLM
jgi:hypothetical protein